MSAVDMTSETKTEAKKKFFEEKLTTYQVTDKRTFDDLAKMCHDELKIPRGSMHDTKRILGKVCQEKGITFKNFKNSKSLAIKIEQTPRDPTKLANRIPQSAPQPTNQVQNPGNSKPETAGQPTQSAPQQTEQKKILPPLTEQDLPRYSRKSFRFLKLVDKVYLKLSLVTEEEVKERQTEFEDISKDIADYCVETNSRLPAQLDFYLILGQLGIMVVLPIVKWFFRPKKKDDKKTEQKKEQKPN